MMVLQTRNTGESLDIDRNKKKTYEVIKEKFKNN